MSRHLSHGSAALNNRRKGALERLEKHVKEKGKDDPRLEIHKKEIELLKSKVN